MITLLLATSSFAATLDITYVYKNIVEGYDHTHQLYIYADGQEIGKSAEGLESKKTTATVTVPDKAFDLKIVDYALYEGNWEPHTIENNYSIDAVVEMRMKKAKKHKLNVVFDLDNGTSFKGK